MEANIIAHAWLTPAFFFSVSIHLRPKTFSTREPTPTNTTSTTRNIREQYNMRFSVCKCKRALSQARHVLEGTSHQTRPKIDAGDSSLLIDSIN
jgi:hypothetical protein